jgi:hypothetical protein
MQHGLRQPNNILNKRQARYLRDFQPFVGTMTLAYRKGSHERSRSVKPETILRTLGHGTITLGWRGSMRCIFATEVPAVVRGRVVKLDEC